MEDVGAWRPCNCSRAPCEETALAGAIEAGEKRLIAPILVGPAAKIQEIATAHSIAGEDPYRRCPSQPWRSRQSRRLVRQGEAELLMKGSPHPTELLSAVIAERNRSAHGSANQSRVHHGRARPTKSADRHRRGDQHRAGPRGPRSTSVRTAIDLAATLGVKRPEGRDSRSGSRR